LDRRTNSPEGSGVASPTAVTTRAVDDNLNGNDVLETQPSDIMAAPSQTPRKSASVTTASQTTALPNGNGSDRTAHGSLVTSDAPAGDTDIDGADEDPDAVDTTVADGVPALPADIGSLWGRKVDPDPPGTEDEDDGSPVFSFGPPEAVSKPIPLAADDWVASESESNDWLASEPAEPDPPGSLWSSSLSSGSGSSGTGSSGSSSSGGRSSGSGSSGGGSSTAELPAVSAAAFAWEMPDPPPDSPSSPARTFLRTGVSAKPAVEKPPAAASKPQAPTVSVKKPAVSVGPPNQKTPQAAQKKKAASKRSARQAHLTIARVEPTSVMKVSFIVSLVAFVILFVAVSVIYGVLAGLGVFDSLQRVVSSLTSSQSSAGVNAETWFSASRILGYTALLGSINIVIITAMSTIGAVVYNLTSRLVGGVEVTLRETE
jgi:uncharacterized membrane protein YgcG